MNIDWVIQESYHKGLKDERFNGVGFKSKYSLKL